MEPLKNLFDENFVRNLALKIKKYEKKFKENEYTFHILERLDFLELKERIRFISSSLHPFLENDYKQTIKILKKVKNELTPELSGLQLTVFPDYVEVYGLEDFETSIDALEHFTIDSTSEFAIRHFIIRYEKETMSILLNWAQSSNEHLRRLASEGCRPRLPWGISLPSFKNNPKEVLRILEHLKYDKSMYVKKSIANNLNDISKDNPELVINFLEKNLGLKKDLDWICKHASRTLLKKGDEKTLELFGYKKDDLLSIKNFSVDSHVALEEKLNFSFDLDTTKERIGNTRIEFAIDFLKANDTLSRKVFMLSQNKIEHKSKSFKKYYSFKTITTRKYYKGLHKIAIIVNGEEKIIKKFELI